MAIRKIVLRGDEILTKKCKPVKEINERIRTLCADMIETMEEAEGVGLAAPQVGVMKRIFVCRPELDDQDHIYVMINPEILEAEGEQESSEGCLSVPGYIGTVTRPERVTIRATDLDGVTQEYTFTGFAATCICHENDHLEGIVYTDKAVTVMTTEEFDALLAEQRAAQAPREGEPEA